MLKKLCAVAVMSMFLFVGISVSASAQPPFGPQGDAPFEPPVENGEAARDMARNAAGNGVPTFLQVTGYQPWAVLVINPGKPDGVDTVSVSFENETLYISASDADETNSVHILINKEFADTYLSSSEGNLDITTSDAVNYKGMSNSNASAGGGAVYVFHIQHFSDQWIEISEGEGVLPVPSAGIPLLLFAAAATVFLYRRR